MEYPSDYCLTQWGAYGACVREICHPGSHRDANGHEFVTYAGKHRMKVYRAATFSDVPPILWGLTDQIQVPVATS